MCKSVSKAGKIALAAQSDLVLLSAEMLRPPQPARDDCVDGWQYQSVDELRQLVINAFGGADVEVAGFESLNLIDALLETQQLALKLAPDQWSDEYWRLFDSSQACALNQASYIRRDKGTILGDLCGFYNAFGFQANLACGERPDHLVIQLEFVGMLLAMMALAKDESQSTLAADALAKFARQHMHDWLPSVCQQLTESTVEPFFGAVAQWLMLYWSKSTNWHQWPVDELSSLALKQQSESENPYECGAPDLIQLTGKSKQEF